MKNCFIPVYFISKIDSSKLKQKGVDGYLGGYKEGYKSGMMWVGMGNKIMYKA